MTNPAPQPHADDVKLAEAKWFERVSEQLCDDKFGEMDDKDIPSAVAKIFNDDPPPELRLSNEALRERVKELEAEIVDREKVHQNLLQDFCGMDDKLTLAGEVIEKCERALKYSLVCKCPDEGPCIKDKALDAIKEWKDKI